MDNICKENDGPAPYTEHAPLQSYNVPGLPLFLASEKIYHFPRHRTQPRWNEDLELLYIKHGQMELVVNGHSICLDSGDICMIDSGCVHFFRSNAKDDDCEYYVGLCNESLFCQSDEVCRKYINPVFHAFHPNYDIISPEAVHYGDIHDVFLRIYSLFLTRQEGFELLMIAAFHELMALLFAELKGTFFLSSSTASAEDEAFRRILQYIKSNFSKKITITDLCNAGAISRNQCFELFHRYTDSSPMDFIIHYRLSYARSLLKNSNDPIAEVASVSGFTHQSHFTSLFVRYYGVTPLRYRKGIR